MGSIPGRRGDDDRMTRLAAILLRLWVGMCLAQCMDAMVGDRVCWQVAEMQLCLWSSRVRSITEVSCRVARLPLLW
jgi:hypothetical protein